MIGSFPREEYETMPDERVDIPDRLDIGRIRLLTTLDIRGAGG